MTSMIATTTVRLSEETSRLRSHRKVPDPGARNATRTRRVAHPFSSHVPKPDRARTRGRRPGVTGRHSGVILVES
jgi:hypothetical protein